MASTCTSALFIVALLLFTTHGHGQLLPGLVSTADFVAHPPETCPGQGVNGTVVKLNCTNLLGVSTTVGQSTTNTTGSFSITDSSFNFARSWHSHNSMCCHCSTSVERHHMPCAFHHHRLTYLNPPSSRHCALTPH
ncbi:UNVERIFIED_CONTAM: hypothetical protein Sindi_3055200 [Sesamum indicum]